MARPGGGVGPNRNRLGGHLDRYIGQFLRIAKAEGLITAQRAAVDGTFEPSRASRHTLIDDRTLELKTNFSEAHPGHPADWGGDRKQSHRGRKAMQCHRHVLASRDPEGDSWVIHDSRAVWRPAARPGPGHVPLSSRTPGKKYTWE